MHRRSEQNGTAPVPSAQVILDTLAAPVAVLDQVGTIVATNRAWDEFGQANHSRETSHIGVNYLDVCARATGGDAPCARAAAAGIRSVLAGERAFSLEYPCHSPDRHRWFQLRATHLEDRGAVYAVVAHHDITERILIGQERQGYLARAHWHQEQLRALAAASAKIAAAGPPEATFREIADQARLIIGTLWAAAQTMSYGLWPHASVALSLSETSEEAPLSAIAGAADVFTCVVQSGRTMRLTAAELSQERDESHRPESSPPASQGDSGRPDSWAAGRNHGSNHCL